MGKLVEKLPLKSTVFHRWLSLLPRAPPHRFAPAEFVPWSNHGRGSQKQTDDRPPLHNPGSTRSTKRVAPV